MEEKILKDCRKRRHASGRHRRRRGVDKEEAAKVIKKLAKEGKIYSPKRCFYDIQK